MQRSISTLCVSFLVLGGALVSSPLRAEDEVSLPRDTKFVLQLDLNALHDTEFGSRLFDLAQETLVNELANESKGDEGPSLEKIHDVLGFDPFREVQQITLSASDYENPEKSLCAIVHMKATTGNLEGLMLALPGYESDEYRGHQIHFASPDDDVQLFGAIHEGRSRGKRIVLSSDRSTVESLVDHWDGRSRDRGEVTATVFEPGDVILNLQVLEFPTEMIDEGPHANVARLLKHLSVKITEAKGDLDMVLTLAAKNPRQTEQLHQMMKGLIAMLDLAQSLEPDDQDFQAFMELVHDLETSQDGESIKVSVSLSSDKLLKLIEQELE